MKNFGILSTNSFPAIIAVSREQKFEWFNVIEFDF